MKKETKDLIDNSIENNFLAISNSIIKSRFRFTIITQKLILFLISHITYEERKEGKFLHTLNFKASQIYNFYKEIGIEKSKDLKERLKLSVKEISAKPINLFVEINNQTKEKDYQSYPWYTSILFKEKTNEFSFRFNNDIAGILLNVKGYFKSYLKEFTHLKSTHAINLYMFFRAHEFEKKKQRIISVEELKKYLSLDENKGYSRWAIFKEAVLDKSIQQLNQNTNFIFTYTLERVGREIGFIHFSIIDKKDAKAITKELLTRIEAYLKTKKASGLFNHFECLQFSYDSQKDRIDVLVIKNYYNKSQLEGLDDLIIKTEIAKNIFQKLFRKKTSYHYRVLTKPSIFPSELSTKIKVC